jgi:hypothetical protein
MMKKQPLSKTEPHELEYNTQLPQLILSEYGRHVQKMVEMAVAIKDKQERNSAAQAIIVIMGALMPQLRDYPDYRHKLWDHLFIISDFKLDVDSPYPKPSAETLKSKPNRMQYPSYKIAYKHYGKVLEELIKKGVEMEEGEMKTYYVETLANLMKKDYLSWNRDSVADETIYQHLSELSEGKLKVGKDFVLKNTNDILATHKPQNQNQGGGGGGGGKKKFHKKKFRKKY